MTNEERILVLQWRSLRSWLVTHQVLTQADRPCGLGDWSVRDLVVHLGYGLHMITEVRRAEEEPIPLVSYVAGYAAASRQIASDTTDLAASLGSDVLGGVDRLVAEAWDVLTDGLPQVVRGRRGPLLREDYLTTRLIELVVHGDDLHRLLDGTPSPLLHSASSLVADVLAGAYGELAGTPPKWSGLELVRAASGREPVNDPWLPLLS